PRGLPEETLFAFFGRFFGSFGGGFFDRFLRRGFGFGGGFFPRSGLCSALSAFCAGFFRRRRLRARHQRFAFRFGRRHRAREGRFGLHHRRRAFTGGRFRIGFVAGFRSFGGMGGGLVCW